MKYTLEGVALVAVFGSLYLVNRARKFVTGDKTPTMVVPFVGVGARRA